MALSLPGGQVADWLRAGLLIGGDQIPVQHEQVPSHVPHVLQSPVTRPQSPTLRHALKPAADGPQRGDLADDIAAALAANPAAGAFFDTLARFYRKAYLRWIDATTRRPDLRAARIAEVVGLLAAGIKERPRS
jgi:Bacteriocin-protection, YdeI or OmpD-Associated